MQRSAACWNEFFGDYSLLKSATCACAAGAGTHFDKGRRDDISSAFVIPPSKSFPEFPVFQGHTFYMVTPSGSGGAAFSAAITDLLRCSSWFVAAYAISATERKEAAKAGRKPKKHLHYLVALPSYVDAWLERWPKVQRGRKQLPCVDCSILDDVCHLVYSEITNVDGLENYLCGSKNRADFFVLKDTFPRRGLERKLVNRLEATKKDLSGSVFGSSSNTTSCKSLNLHDGTQSLKPKEGRQPKLTTFHLNNVDLAQRSFATRRYASYGLDPISGFI